MHNVFADIFQDTQSLCVMCMMAVSQEPVTGIACTAILFNDS